LKIQDTRFKIQDARSKMQGPRAKIQGLSLEEAVDGANFFQELKRTQLDS
jgi:hypothetical protein